MSQHHSIIKGTIFLTFAGLFTRTAGFFYKIFLSRTIGAKEIGLFQLTLPVYAFCMAAACGGIQTAVSRFTAELHAKQEGAKAKQLLFSALLFSCFLSVFAACLLSVFAEPIAVRFLLEPSCTSLLKIIAVSLPFSAIHSCITGYFIGKKNVAVSGISQFIEQLLRIGSSLFFFLIFSGVPSAMDARIMALGQVAGEAASSLYCILCLLKDDGICLRDTRSWNNLHRILGINLPKILAFSLPLSLNRTLMGVLQGIESSLLPQKLQQAGLSRRAALSSYGTLTGMALPLLFFPTALTGAVSTLLLPTVSEARALHEDQRLRSSIRLSILCSCSMGLLFLGGFAVFGTFAGSLLFQSTEAGIYIRKLAFLCPFLYLNTTLISVLHGLGRSASVFFWNIIAFFLRLAAILLLVPKSGMAGYFVGMVGSQFFLSLCTLFSLRCYLT